MFDDLETELRFYFEEWVEEMERTEEIDDLILPDPEIEEDHVDEIQY